MTENAKPKKSYFKRVINVLITSAKAFIDDKVTKLSGSLAYATIFSLAPFLVVIISLFSLFMDRSTLESGLVEQLKGLTGEAAALQVKEILDNASLSGKSKLALIIGLATLLFGATTVFAEIQDSINTIWGIKPKPKRGWLKMIKTRLLSFSLIVSMGFILVVSLGLNSVMDLISKGLMAKFPDVTVWIFYVLNFVITFIIVTIIFGIIFKVLPDAKIAWGNVRAGAITTAILFMLGKFLISLYITQSNFGSTFGTAASFVVIIVWVYFSSLILFYGAEFTKTWALEFGSRIYPDEYAVSTKIVELQSEGEAVEALNKTNVVVKNSKEADEAVKNMGEVVDDIKEENKAGKIDNPENDHKAG